VKVEMTNIGANITRRSETHLGVKVSTVHVNLTSVLVNGIANLFNISFEDTMS
jgi:hypothetical protein